MEISAMNAILFGAAPRERLAIASDESGRTNAWDAAWIVLEAANDLGDDPTVDACRRFIDANLNGTTGSPSDLHVILNYFR
jgi:hypothetical protein